MIWLLIPLGWVLASITIALGFNGFLKAERAYIEMLDRASDRAQRLVEREMRPQSEIEAERAAWATQAQGMAWAQQNAMPSYGNQQANYHQSMGLLGSGPYGGLFGFGYGGIFR